MNGKSKKVSLFLVLAVLFMTLPAMVEAVHEPPGIRANTGYVNAGGFSAFIDSYSSKWTTHTVYDYSGDLYAKGHSLSGGPYKLIYYCIIKISPADSTHKYLSLKLSGDFEYWMSCSWWSGASWELQFGSFDMVSSNIVQEGWGEGYFKKAIGGFWPESYGHHKYFPDTFYRIYDRPVWELPGSEPVNNRVEFSNTEWYYVGVVLTLSINGAADFALSAGASGNSHFNPTRITWMFEE